MRQQQIKNEGKNKKLSFAYMTSNSAATH